VRGMREAGPLDVQHIVCKRTAAFQLWQWKHPTDPHKLHCVRRHESAGAGESPDRVEPPAHLDHLKARTALVCITQVNPNRVFA